MKVQLHELAASEYREAVEWYELQARGLGEKFKISFFEQVKFIRHNPEWFLKEQENIYKAFLPKFPYKILYTIEESKIITWAIAHLHREPSYWQKRLDS